MLKMEEFLLMRDLHNQGLNISQIARETGFNRRTVRRHLAAEVPPVPQKRTRRPSKLDDYTGYIQHRIAEYPLSVARIYREIQKRGFDSKYTIVKDYAREIRPNKSISAVFRYEIGSGVQAQVDWTECGHLDGDERRRKLSCFSIILGYSRMCIRSFVFDHSERVGTGRGIRPKQTYFDHQIPSAIFRSHHSCFLFLIAA